MTNRRTDERATPARTRTAPGDASLPASHATLPTAGHTDVHQARLCLESWLQAYITAAPPPLPTDPRDLPPPHCHRLC